MAHKSKTSPPRSDKLQGELSSQQRFSRIWWRLWPSFVLISSLPIFADYMRNRSEVSIQDLGLPLLLNFITATIVALLSLRRARRDVLAAYITGLLVLFVYTNNFDGRFQSAFTVMRSFNPIPSLPSGLEAVLFSLVFAALIFVLMSWIARWLSHFLRTRTKRINDVVTAATLAVAVTFLFQVTPAIKYLAIAWPQFFYRPPQLSGVVPNNTSTKAKPDIYYIVLDRYGSADMLKREIGYDNSDFVDYLKTKDFHVNNNARSNYPYTAMSIASTMQADYVTNITNKFGTSSEQTLEPYNWTVRDSPVMNTLQKQGYKYSLVGNWYETSNLSSIADQTYQKEGILTVAGKKYTLDSFTKNELQQSIYWRLVSWGIHIGSWTLLTFSDIDNTNMVKYQMDTLRDLAKAPPGGRAIFAHFLVPHDPFYFNADGSLSTTPGVNNEGKLVTDKYIGQVKYINSQMREVIDSIKKNSQGQAVIILQADEGPYPMHLIDQNFDSTSANHQVQQVDMRSWSDAALKMKYGILAAYHIPAASQEAMNAGADSVNVFRLVFNTYFGSTMSYLPQCSYGLPAGRQQAFTYVDITQRLSGKPSPLCTN